MSRLAVVALFAAGCLRESKDPELVARIAKLESRADAHDKDAARGPSSSQAALAAAENLEYTRVLERKIDDLARMLAVLESKLLHQAAPATAVKRRTADPTATYAVPIGASPVLGSPQAKVTMVMAFEFACKYCRRAWDTVDDLRKKYGKELRVVYKQYVVHPPTATAAANASCAAHQQGRWRETAELLWTKAFDARKLDQANIDAIAAEVGLDMTRYQADIAGICPAQIKADQAMLAKLGTNGTPTFYINGRYFEGAKDIAEFSRLIDEELAEANALIKKGVKPEKLYAQEIVGKGITEIPAP